MRGTSSGAESLGADLAWVLDVVGRGTVRAEAGVTTLAIDIAGERIRE
ncbi:MAG: hypothetical protein ACYC1Z_08245 [Georgenia sp.]